VTLPAGIRVAWREVPAGSKRRDVSRALLAELLPGARFTSRCPACGADHGRVRVEGADAAASVSYAGGWAVVATASGHESVGVDAVPGNAAGLERVLPPVVCDRPAGLETSATRAEAGHRAAGGEQARAWARVEAVLKADGRALGVDPRCVEVTLNGARWSARVRSPSSDSAEAGDDGEAGARERRWRGWDLDGPDGVVLAVAVEARADDVSV